MCQTANKVVSVTEALVLEYHRVNSRRGVRRQIQAEVASDHDETSQSITAVSATLAASSVLKVLP